MPKFTILEPMSTGDIIDRAVRLYRRNFTSLLAIVSVPTLIGYISSLLFWYGYANLFSPMATESAPPGDAVWMLILGVLGFPVWLFSLLLTVAGLSRAVGDHVMMGEPITFRKCFASVRRKLADMVVMGLLSLAICFGIYIALIVVILILVIMIGLIGGLIVSAHLPQWVLTLIMAIVGIIAVAAVLAVISIIFARVVFLPQIVMIEGESAGSAVGRAMRLGKGNWYRVGSIVVFTYFVSLSMMWALLLPVLAGLYMSGMIGEGFYSSSTWNVFYTSFKDISTLLSLPIWIVSFTLLYFDSRVRKEAYDVELLAREAGAEFYWQPAAVAQPAFAGFEPTRTFGQTSPLGLSGFIPRAPVAPVAAVNSNPTPAPVSNAGPDISLSPVQEIQPAIIEPAVQDDGNKPPFLTSASCEQCGNRLENEARFCSYCGKPARQVSSA